MKAVKKHTGTFKNGIIPVTPDSQSVEPKEPWEELPPPKEGQRWLHAALQGCGQVEALSANVSVREGVPGTFFCWGTMSEPFSAL